jgi:hypothetical protein
VPPAAQARGGKKKNKVLYFFYSWSELAPGTPAYSFFHIFSPNKVASSGIFGGGERVRRIFPPKAGIRRRQLFFFFSGTGSKLLRACAFIFFSRHISSKSA